MATPKSRLAAEIAEASRTIEPVIYAKPTHANVLVDVAKRLQRLQTKRAKLRRELKTVQATITAAKRDLRAVAQQIGRGE